MSGGHFDYKDQYAKDEIFGWGNKPSNVFEDREISELVWDVFNLIHDYDWYASGDTSEGNWNKSKKDFKGKWLTQEGQKARFSKYIDDAVAELKSDLGLLSEAFCYNCEYYTKRDDSECYGRCAFEKLCSFHEYKSACEKWKEKTE